MYVGSLPEDEESIEPAKEEYINLKPDGIHETNADDGSGAELEAVDSSKIGLPCDGSPCTPESYIKLLEAE